MYLLHSKPDGWDEKGFKLFESYHLQMFFLPCGVRREKGEHTNVEIRS